MVLPDFLRRRLTTSENDGPKRASRSDLPTQFFPIPYGGLDEAIKPPDLVDTSTATDGGDDCGRL
jgi:hypothetical protein